VPDGTVMLHAVGQSIPGGEDVTRPEPFPLSLTLRLAVVLPVVVEVEQEQLAGAGEAKVVALLRPPPGRAVMIGQVHEGDQQGPGQERHGEQPGVVQKWIKWSDALYRASTQKYEPHLAFRTFDEAG